MFFRSLARASTLFSTLALLVLVTTTAYATPPTWTGNPISALFENDRIIVNLKDQNVLVGGPPINVAIGQVTVDGQPSSLVGVTQPLQGGVCLAVEDEGFASAVNNLVTVQLTAINGLGEQTTTVVSIVRQAGAEVNIGDPAQI